MARLWVGVEKDTENGYRKDSRIACCRRCMLIIDGDEEV